MIAVQEGKDLFLTNFSSFEERLSEDRRSPLRRLRRAALERFAALGFPGPKDEDWRFTNLAPLMKYPFELGDIDDDSPCDQSRLIPADRPGTHLAFENGCHPLFRHQGPGLPDGVMVCSLKEALARRPDLVERHLAQYADYASHPFTALNTAYLHDGAFVYIPPGTVVEEPIYLTFHTTATDAPLVWHRRCLIVGGPDSRARIVESYQGSGGVYFTNALTEIVLAETAKLDYYRPQSEGRQAFHIATVQVRQERGSVFQSCNVAHGGTLARTELNVVLDGEGSECTLNGLYLAGDDQLIDNHTRIDHARPRCTSHELYKGILAGRARGVFHGKIHVHPDAQKTDARQNNRTLLLSDDAMINSTPQLEIYADDVKCTHGASIGRLDAEQIFYLRTRGLDRAAARQLLTYAFANDIINRIQIDPLRAQLEASLFAHSTVKEAE